MRTLLDLRGAIPASVLVSGGKIHELNDSGNRKILLSNRLR
jgi:hypothetical protein